MADNILNNKLTLRIQQLITFINKRLDELANKKNANTEKTAQKKDKAYQNYLLAFNAFEKDFEAIQSKCRDAALKIFIHAQDFNDTLSKKYVETLKKIPHTNYMQFLAENNASYTTPQILIDTSKSVIEQRKEMQESLEQHYKDYLSNVEQIENHANSSEKILNERKNEMHHFRAFVDSIENKRSNLAKNFQNKIDDLHKDLEIFEVEMSALRETEISKKWVALRKENKISVGVKDEAFTNSIPYQLLLNTYNGKIQTFHEEIDDLKKKEDRVFSEELIRLDNELTNYIDEKTIGFAKEMMEDIENLEANHDHSLSRITSTNSSPLSEIQMSKKQEEDDAHELISEMPEQLTRQGILKVLPRIDQMDDKTFEKFAIQVTHSFHRQISFFWDSLLKNEPIKRWSPLKKEKCVNALFASLDALEEQSKDHERFSKDRTLLTYHQLKRSNLLKYLRKIAPELDMQELTTKYTLNPMIENYLNTFEQHLMKKNTSTAVQFWNSYDLQITQEMKEFLSNHNQRENTQFLTNLFNLVINVGVSNVKLCFNFFKKTSEDLTINNTMTGYLPSIKSVRNTFLENGQEVSSLAYLKKTRTIKEILLNSLAQKKPLDIEMLNPTHQPSFFKVVEAYNKTSNAKRNNTHTNLEEPINKKARYETRGCSLIKG